MKTKIQPKPMRIKISPKAKYEWSCKEEGSWEDHGRPESGHVFCLLTNHKRDILIHNEEEFKLLMISAAYNGSGSWDTGEKAVEIMMKACDRIAMMKYTGVKTEQPSEARGEYKINPKGQHRIYNAETDMEIANCDSKETAQLIVKAVNMHDELVKFLSQEDAHCRNIYEAGYLSDDAHERWNKIKELLKQAEQK